MIQNKFRRFRPVSSIDEQLYSGVAALQPHPPPERSSVPDRRDDGNIIDSLQSVHTGLRPNPPPRRIPFRSRTIQRTALDDTWNRSWAQSVKRHTGVVLPPLTQPKKPRMPPQRTQGVPQIRHLLCKNGKEHQTAQQYTADIRECIRKEYTDLGKKEIANRKEIKIEDRMRRDRKHEEEVKKQIEKHFDLISTMASFRTEIPKAEAEAQSLVFAIRGKEKEIWLLKERIEDIKLEIQILQEGYQKIAEYTGLMEFVPPDLWETVMKNIEDCQIKSTGFQLLLETDLEYTEFRLHEERGKMLLLKSIREKIASLAKQQKITTRIIMDKRDLIEQLTLKISIISQQKTEDDEILKEAKDHIESVRDSLKVLKMRDMNLVKTITASD